MTRSTADAASRGGPLSDHELRRIDAYWRAANYLSVGQIYLRYVAIDRVPGSSAAPPTG